MSNREFQKSGVSTGAILLAILSLILTISPARGQCPLVFENSIGMKLRRIPPGSFQMGSEKAENPEQRKHEGAVHKVTITKPFYIGIYEVSQAEYEAIMSENPSGYGHPEKPVETVSWDEANKFCKALSRKEGATYRLPTEAEWEYCCRAGTTTEYFWGDYFDPSYAWCSTNSGKKPFKVGYKMPNNWGLCDMSGNVWELCSDDYQDRYSSYDEVDPQGSSSGYSKVARGGSCVNAEEGVRSADRLKVEDDKKEYWLGFRVVKEISEEEAATLLPPVNPDKAVTPETETVSEKEVPEPARVTVFPLHQALLSGNLALVHNKANTREVIDSKGDEGCSLLFLAVQTGQTSLLQKFLKCGGNVNSLSPGFCSPLMIACQDGNSEIVKILLENGANVDLIDGSRKTALMYARERMHVEIEKMLLKAGAKEFDPDKVDNDLFLGIKNDDFQMVENSIASGAKVNRINKAGMTPLMAAAFFNRLKIAEFLLKKRANIDAVNRTNGVTALMLAAIAGNEEFVKLLVSRNADMHLRDNHGKTALMIASEKQNEKMVTLLKSLGAIE